MPRPKSHSSTSHSPKQWRRAGALAAAGGLAAALAVAVQPAQAAGARPSWVRTQTKAVTLHGAKLLGATPAHKSVHLAVSLPLRHRTAQQAALRAIYKPGSATYHHYLTPAQFRSRYAPTTAQVDRVKHYLSSHGFTGVHADAGHLVITANGNAAKAEKAFHTTLRNYRLRGHTYFANTSAAKVPASLGSSVLAVIGLTNVPMRHPHPLVHKQATGSPSPFNILAPKDFRNTYHAAGTPSGKATSIALFTEGKLTQVYKDLRKAESVYKLPRVSVTQVNVGPQSSDTAGLDEWDMDTQVSTAMATTVRHLYLYNAGSLTDASIVPTFARFVSDNKARGMSASIGGCDIGPFLDGSLVTTDEIEEQGAMQGQSLFASSGDNGAGCMYGAAVGVPTAPTGTNWPASSEYSTAVGGTSLVSDANGNRVQELGWVGSGGGISAVENPGWWTEDTDPGYANQYASGGRAVPDIALDADPNVSTAAAVYVNGAVTGVGGTSLSSPLMLGAWSRLESAHHNKLGLASIALYRLYDKVNPGTAAPGGLNKIPTPNPAPVKGFTDITVGDNGPYPCTPGYDLVTGLGAPDIAALAKAL